MSKISVRLVLDAENRQWIIGKIAARLAENLEAHGVTADIGETPRDDADVIHWMHYLQPWRHYYPVPGFFSPGWSPGRARNTAMITHVDDPVKLQAIKEAMSRVLDAGICVSRMMKAELVEHGIDSSRLTYIHLAHDGLVQPRRILIGITSRMYSDGRKNEGILVKVAQSMRLDAFRFEIIGEGWEEVAVLLRSAGAEVEIAGSGDHPDHPDSGYARILRRLPLFDYYLYLGWDEGSMGTLDALAAGVKTIVTPQGFHLDLPGGITHAPRNAGDLLEIFQGIAAERQVRLDSVRDLTWSEYARKHAAVWRALVEGRTAEIAKASGELELDSRMERPITQLDISAARSRLNRRLLRSDFWSCFFESRRFWLRGKLSRVKRWMLRRDSK